MKLEINEKHRKNLKMEPRSDSDTEMSRRNSVSETDEEIDEKEIMDKNERRSLGKGKFLKS